MIRILNFNLIPYPLSLSLCCGWSDVCGGKKASAKTQTEYFNFIVFCIGLWLHIKHFEKEKKKINTIGWNDEILSNHFTYELNGQVCDAYYEAKMKLRNKEQMLRDAKYSVLNIISLIWHDSLSDSFIGENKMWKFSMKLLVYLYDYFQFHPTAPHHHPLEM